MASIEQTPDWQQTPDWHLLAERLQFDGDAPELRAKNSKGFFTPLPRGSFPAVPVRTKSLCPRVQTAQLLWARQQVQDAMEDFENQFGGKLLQADGKLPSRADLPEYPAGEIPPLMEVPDGVLWAEEAKHQKDVTLALYSTQGIRSSRQALEDHLREMFPDLWFDTVEDNNLKARRRKTYPWMAAPTGLFAPAVVALRVFRKTILEEPSVSRAEIRSITRFSERIFGWELRLA